MGEDKIVSRSYLSVCSRAASMHTRPGVQECRLAVTFITLLSWNYHLTSTDLPLGNSCGTFLWSEVEWHFTGFRLAMPQSW